MPAALEYAPPGSQERRALMPFDSEKRDRIEAFDKAWDYYNGKHKKFLQIKEGEPDDNVVLNLVRMSADRTVNFLYPEIPEFRTIEGETIDVTKNNAWVYEMLAANGGLAFFQSMMLIGLLSGHIYIRIVPPNPAEGRDYPKLVPLTPHNAQTYWRSGDYRDILWHEVSWKTGEVEYVIDFINRGTYWEIMQYRYERGWELMADKSGRWESPYSPIIHWQHLPNPNSFYGLSEVADVSLQDTLNLVLSEGTRILRYHASPRTIVKGVEAEDIQETGIDNLWVIENPEASVQNLEMVSQLEASRQFASLMYDSFLALNRTVLLRGEVKDFQRVTNTGVRTVFMDALAKRNTLSNQYGHGMANVIHRAALVANKGNNFRVLVQHVDPLPLDELEQARVDTMRLNIKSLTHKAIVTRDGDSWDEHLAQLAEEYANPIFNPMLGMQQQMNTGDGAGTQNDPLADLPNSETSQN